VLPVVSSALVASAQAQTTTAQASRPAGAGFSFAAVGDTRPMMYLPLKEGNRTSTSSSSKCSAWSCRRRSLKRVAKDVKMIFDPDTKELIKVVMPFASKTEVMTLTVDKGWVTEASGCPGH